MDFPSLPQEMVGESPFPQTCPWSEAPRMQEGERVGSRAFKEKPCKVELRGCQNDCIAVFLLWLLEGFFRNQCILFLFRVWIKGKKKSQNIFDSPITSSHMLVFCQEGLMLRVCTSLQPPPNQGCGTWLSPSCLGKGWARKMWLNEV